MYHALGVNNCWPTNSKGNFFPCPSAERTWIADAATMQGSEGEKSNEYYLLKSLLIYLYRYVMPNRHTWCFTEQQTYLKIKFLYTKILGSPNERAEESINRLHFYMEAFYELVHDTVQPGRDSTCPRLLLQIIKINELIKLWSSTFLHMHSQSCKLLG